MVAIEKGYSVKKSPIATIIGRQHVVSSCSAKKRTAELCASCSRSNIGAYRIYCCPILTITTVDHMFFVQDVEVTQHAFGLGWDQRHFESVVNHRCSAANVEPLVRTCHPQ